MDSGGFGRKFPSKATIGVSRSPQNENITNSFTLATVNGVSSIEPSASSSSSDISSSSNAADYTEIRIRNRNRTHAAHEIDCLTARRPEFDAERNHRWTVNSVEKLPIKSYVIDKNGPHLSANVLWTNVNDANHCKQYTAADKAKWAHKSPINGNVAV